MEVRIAKDVDKKTQTARLMSVCQNLMMGTEVTIVVSPDIDMNEAFNVFQKLSEFASLSWDMVKPVETEEENGEWKDSD